MVRTQRYIIVILLIGLTYFFVNQVPSGKPIPLKKNISLLPRNIGKWKSQEMINQKDDLPSYMDQFLYRKYFFDKGMPFFLYIGYWGKFRHNSKVFSGSHLSPGFMWDPVLEKKSFIEIKGKKIPVNEAVYAKGDRKILLIYCYYTDEGIITKRLTGRLKNGLNAIFNHNAGVAQIKIISRPYRDNEKDKVISAQVEFARIIFPLLKEFLPFD